MNPLHYQRRYTSDVQVGGIPLGGQYPVRIQTMADVDTMDTNAAVQQALRTIHAGTDYLRFTTQGTREAVNLGCIRQQIRQLGYNTPIIADVHFNPNAAYAAVPNVDKVRINPGNFSKSAALIEDSFVPLLNLCKQHHTALRIGVNHGSLHPEILAQFGNTPAGMVQSCMSYLHICQSEQFTDVVLSVKASNTVLMVQTVKLLVQTMEQHDMHFPLHLGVTEAGNDEDGRIKSALGIGALLTDGIGDTIRVSLSEPPENELPVAKALVQYTQLRAGYPIIIPPINIPDNLHRNTRVVAGIGGKQTFGALGMSDLEQLAQQHNVHIIELAYQDIDNALLEKIRTQANTVLVWKSKHPDCIADARALAATLKVHNCTAPLILRRDYDYTDMNTLRLHAAVDLGTLLLDGIGDAIMIGAPKLNSNDVQNCMLSILQAARIRFTKTEYIACPGCGRTHYDLHQAIHHVKNATQHMAGLKIAVMGCIVNGPGEMADADYGYVGAGNGTVNLYHGKICVANNIPEHRATEALVQLIKDNGDWKQQTLP